MSVPIKRLGDSGLKVPHVIIGCMQFGSKKWSDFVIEDEEECFKILKKCYDNGLRAFDTADVYSNGLSEIVLGKFIRKFNIPRDKIVILSKCFAPVIPSQESQSSIDPIELANSRGLSRKHIFDAVQASVERLGTYIDVLQIHRLDHDVTFTEIMRALNDVVEKGWTRYIGASSMKAVEFVQLQHIAEINGWHKFVSMQNFYNLLYREEEREMNLYCQQNGIGLIPWSPNARGLLARPLTSEKTLRHLKKPGILESLGIVPLRDSDKEIINRVEELAEKYNVSMMEISTGWLIKKGVTPIVGVMNIEAADDLVNLTKLNLTDKEMEYLEELYEPKWPHI